MAIMNTLKAGSRNPPVPRGGLLDRPNDRASKDMILKLLKVAGETCLMYQDDMLRKVPCKLVQCDEERAGNAVQSRQVRRGQEAIGLRAARCGASFDGLRRAAKPEHPHGKPPLDAVSDFKTAHYALADSAAVRQRQ
jgi:hypothetical protein